MKFIHLLPVFMIAAALGATRERSRHHVAAEEPAGPAHAAVIPPWLTGASAPALPPEVSPGTAVDPHLDVCAGVYGAAADGSDPHAALCGEEGLPAGMAVEAHVAHVHTGDPHAGLTGAEDPHAGLHLEPDDSDPDALDPYERIGLEPPAAVSVPASVARSSAANGRSVAEVFAERSALDGKRVSVRGTVVKLVEGVLGKTYLHLRDGSGSAEAGDDDLTATTTEGFELGETVEVEGLLAIDRDVGAGYRYAALLGDVRRTGR